jgi:hypothetical protein
MNEDLVRGILGDMIQPDGSLYDLGTYVAWNPKNKEATLDGQFDAITLSAIAWWMYYKQVNDGEIVG